MKHPHDCPHCRCEPQEIMIRHGVRMDPSAPFFGLVTEISRITHTKETT
jgi:hypothetical protein